MCDVTPRHIYKMAKEGHSLFPRQGAARFCPTEMAKRIKKD
jgi:hypothetical protein